MKIASSGSPSTTTDLTSISGYSQGFFPDWSLVSQPVTPTPTPSVTPTATPVPTCVVQVNSNIPQAFVRDDASSSGSIIGYLFANQQVTVVGAYNGWYEFFAASSAHWVSDQVVTPTPANSCDAITSPVGYTPGIPQISGVYCLQALIPNSILDYCRDTIYNNLWQVYQDFDTDFNTAHGHHPTLRELTAITIQTEFWTNRGYDSNIVPIGTEGLSRNLFEQCDTDGCNPMETLYYLSGYQPWLIGTSGQPATVTALLSAYSAISSDLSNPSSDISQATDDVITPPDSSWEDGQVSDQPWQWFNRNTSSSRPNIGTHDCTEVLLRVSAITFEMYTALQDYNIGAHVCGYT